MQKTIPARTVTVCDRCHEEIVNLGAGTRLEVNPRYNDETCEEGHDLCRSCKGEFNEFMRNER